MEDKAIGMALHALDTTMRRFMDTHSHRREHDALTGSNTWVLLFLADSGDTPVYLRDVERRFGVTRSTASKVVNLLCTRGYVERHTVAADARLRRLRLTPKAQRIITSIREDRIMLQSTLTRGFTANEVDTVYLYLRRMRENMAADLGEEMAPHD